MKLTKRLLGLLMVLMLLMTAAGCGGGDEPKKDSGEKPAVPDKAEKIFLNIATGGTSGVYYPLGGTMAEILTKNIPNVTATAQTSGASVANVNMLAAGDVQLAFVQNDIAYYAEKILRLDPVRIEAGSRADLTLIDPGREVKVSEDYFESKSKNCAFLGQTLMGAATEIGRAHV